MAATARLHLLRPPTAVVNNSVLLSKLHRLSVFSNPNSNIYITRIRKLSFSAPLCSNPDSIPEGSSSSGSSPSIVGDLLDYLNESWTQFHATAEAKRQLINAGYHLLNENDEWDLKPGGRYLFTRNLSCLVAFAVGEKYRGGNGFHIIAAHTDSPCLKLKPKSTSSKSGYLMVNVQTYGAGLWHTWFDRDLSLAGRVIVREKDGSFSHKLIKLKRPILRIPTLAIHLDRTVNKDGFKPNLETHLIPLLATKLEDTSSDPKEKSIRSKVAHHPLLMQVLSDELSCGFEDVASIELNVCDIQPSCLGGANNEFIFSGRLDNLTSSYCALRALLDSCETPGDLSSEHAIRMIALFDNEEVGSVSAQGAGAPTMFEAMRRIVGCLAQEYIEGAFDRAIHQSFLGIFNKKLQALLFSTGISGTTKLKIQVFDMIIKSSERRRVGRPVFELFHVANEKQEKLRTEHKRLSLSADMAHGVHPNFMDKHEEHHRPELQKGLVIKHNANQRYATSGVTAFLFKEVAKIHNLPTQEFVVRNDMGCGSTIGPILASGVGVRTVDCGIAQLSMHSIREICGKEDIDIAYKHFKAFYQTFSSVDKKLNVD